MVLARKQQSVVPKGGDPRAPQRIALSLRERAVVASLERTLPPLTDTTAPATTILRKPETLTRNTTAAFTFRASEAGVTFAALWTASTSVCARTRRPSSHSPSADDFAVRRPTRRNTGSTAIYSWRITGASYRQIIARDATDVRLEVDARSRARVTYRVDGRAQSVLAWGAINAVPATEGGAQERFILLYGAPPIRTYTGPARARPWRGSSRPVPRLTAHIGLYSSGSGTPVFGDPPASPEAAGYELHLSRWSGPLTILEIKADWAYRKYDHLYGRLTYRGEPVYGFASTSAGHPRDIFGRNIFIDTYDSAYGPGWKREMGLLTRRPRVPSATASTPMAIIRLQWDSVPRDGGRARRHPRHRLGRCRTWSLRSGTRLRRQRRAAEAVERRQELQDHLEEPRLESPAIPR